MDDADMRDEDLPRSFTFTGKVIFISNMNAENIDQAIRSRSMMIDLSMNADQKIERMETIIQSDEFMAEFEMAHKLDAIALIKELKNTAKDISLRTLIQVTKIRSAGDDEGSLWLNTLFAIKSMPSSDIALTTYKSAVRACRSSLRLTFSSSTSFSI